MEMSEQIIKVLDNLSERFGLAIDWTQTNALPYLQQLETKIINYTIYTDIFWIIVSLITLFITYIFIKKVFIDKDKNNLTLWIKSCENYNDVFVIFSSILLVFASCVGIVAILYNSYDIIQALTFPENTIIEFIRPLLK